MKEALRACLTRLCPEEDLCRWYDPLNLDLNQEGNCLTVTFPHRFFAPWFAKEGQEYFESCLGENITVLYRIKKVGDNFTPPAPQISEKKTVAKGKPFGEDYTLENFVTNKKNFFPLAVARETVKTYSNPSYNPLVYCGKSGSGKTHLLRAVANELSVVFGKRAVFYGNTETFAQKFAQQKKNSGYYTYKAYFFDDIHHIINNTQLQNELTLLLDSCIHDKKQFVCACSGLLSSHEGFSESLRSRLEFGIVAELKDPDIDVRMRFAQTKCTLLNTDITQEQILFLAQQCTHFHHLSGIILKIAAFKKFENKEISNQDIEKILKNSNEYNKISPQSILSRVAAHFSLNPAEITGKKRTPDIVFARQAAIYLCRELMGTSYPALGRFFGGKDHSTIIYSIKKIKKIIITNKETHKEISTLKHQCLNEKK